MREKFVITDTVRLTSSSGDEFYAYDGDIVVIEDQEVYVFVNDLPGILTNVTRGWMIANAPMKAIV